MSLSISLSFFFSFFLVCCSDSKSLLFFCSTLVQRNVFFPASELFSSFAPMFTKLFKRLQPGPSINHNCSGLLSFFLLPQKIIDTHLVLISHLLRAQSFQPMSIYSNAHWFSLRTSSSSSGVKSFLMLKVLRISAGVFPLIMFATVWQHKSSNSLMSK